MKRIVSGMNPGTNSMRVAGCRQAVGSGPLGGRQLRGRLLHRGPERRAARLQHASAAVAELVSPLHAVTEQGAEVLVHVAVPPILITDAVVTRYERCQVVEERSQDGRQDGVGEPVPRCLHHRRAGGVDESVEVAVEEAAAGGAPRGDEIGRLRGERVGRRPAAQDTIDDRPHPRRAQVLGGGAVHDADDVLDPRPARPAVIVHHDALDRLVAVIVVARLPERGGLVVPVAEQAVRSADGVRMLQAPDEAGPVEPPVAARGQELVGLRRTAGKEAGREERGAPPVRVDPVEGEAELVGGAKEVARVSGPPERHVTQRRQREAVLRVGGAAHGDGVRPAAHRGGALHGTVDGRVERDRHAIERAGVEAVHRAAGALIAIEARRPRRFGAVRLAQLDEDLVAIVVHGRGEAPRIVGGPTDQQVGSAARHEGALRQETRPVQARLQHDPRVGVPELRAGDDERLPGGRARG